MFRQINLITAFFAYAQANKALRKRTQDFDDILDFVDFGDIDIPNPDDLNAEQYEQEKQTCLSDEYAGVWIDATDTDGAHCLIYEGIQGLCYNTGCYDSLNFDCAS